MRTSMPWWTLLAGAVGFVATVPRWRRAALAALGGFLAGPLVFANLYQIHDYYHYATAGFLAVAAGMVWLGVTERGGWWRWPGWAGLAVVHWLAACWVFCWATKPCEKKAGKSPRMVRQRPWARWP